jgi:predicted anti-sigma-YlaC factor YlaD
MNCPEAHIWLQRHLDGEPLDRRPLDEHLRQCPACREFLAGSQRLLDGLQLLPVPVPPAHLARRITEQVLADRRRTRQTRLVLATAALAAGVLVAVWTGIQGFRPRPSVAVQREQPKQPPPRAPSLEKQVGEVGQAVASLARRAADETLTTTRSLLPDVPLPRAGAEADSRPPAEAPEQALREVQKGVTAGIEPVTTSARRALSMFARDWSLTQKKQENKN